MHVSLSTSNYLCLASCNSIIHIEAHISHVFLSSQAIPLRFRYEHEKWYWSVRERGGGESTNVQIQYVKHFEGHENSSKNIK